MAEVEEEAQSEGVVEAPSVPVVALVRSKDIGRLAVSLVVAQKKLKNPEKNAVNPHFKNRYADLGATLDAAKAALNDQDIAVIQTYAPTEYGTVGVTTLLVHKSGEYIGGTSVVPTDRSNAQGYGSAATYARRYGVQAIIGMVAEDDDDGAAASGGREEGQSPRVKPVAAKKSLFGKR